MAKQQTIDVFGIDELEAAFEKMQKKYDSKIKSTLALIAQTEYKRVKQMVSGEVVNVKTGNLRKSLKTQSVKEYSQWRVTRTVFTAPHAHLIEEGHELTKGATRKGSRTFSSAERTVRGVKSYGMVAGRHMIQTATDEVKDEFNSRLSDVFGVVLKEYDE